MTELEALEAAGASLAASRGVPNPLVGATADLATYWARFEARLPAPFGLPPIAFTPPDGASSLSAARAYPGVASIDPRTAAVLDVVTGALGVPVAGVRG